MNFRNRIIIFFTLCSLLFSITLFAQSTKESPKSKVIEEPEIDPMYPGGKPAMLQFISSVLDYPDEAAANDLQGLVVTTFTVELDGSLSDFKIIHHADPLLNDEALRILKLMPAWRPGKFNGQFVRSKSYVPMYFRLNKNGRKSTSKSPNSYADRNTLNNSNSRWLSAEEDVFAIVDVMPSYATGEEGLSSFISNRLSYPEKAFKAGIEERILCSFIIGKDGRIYNIEVIEGENTVLNEEAMRVLSLMPDWVPGKNNGENVNVKCILPIEFKIKDKAEDVATQASF